MDEIVNETYAPMAPKPKGKLPIAGILALLLVIGVLGAAVVTYLSNTSTLSAPISSPIAGTINGSTSANLQPAAGSTTTVTLQQTNSANNPVISVEELNCSSTGGALGIGDIIETGFQNWTGNVSAGYVGGAKDCVIGNNLYIDSSEASLPATSLSSDITNLTTNPALAPGTVSCMVTSMFPINKAC
jgi:hypothetical protein